MIFRESLCGITHRLESRQAQSTALLGTSGDPRYPKELKGQGGPHTTVGEVCEREMWGLPSRHGAVTLTAEKHDFAKDGNDEPCGSSGHALST